MQNSWLERVGPLGAVLLKTASAVQGQFVQGGLKAASVACALKTSSGNTYTGVNVDLSCGIGFCAEHSAVARMLEARETHIAAIVAVWDNGHIFAPCGRCLGPKRHLPGRAAAEKC